MQGIIRKIGIEGGVWALITDDGAQVELIEPPEGLRKNGARAEIEIDEARPVEVSIGMLGQAARVKSFRILSD
ncbi:MAG: hypothetical protein RLO52_23525 [Sandaracinaceae bacterium]|nr:MAG: hypothetical protein EVA89_12040 [Sandaracinaceae bacterium]